jgi:hypothetical protein
VRIKLYPPLFCCDIRLAYGSSLAYHVIRIRMGVERKSRFIPQDVLNVSAYVEAARMSFFTCSTLLLLVEQLRLTSELGSRLETLSSR